MGVDLAVYAERRRGDGTWELIQMNNAPGSTSGLNPHLVYADRNHILFSILSNFSQSGGFGRPPHDFLAISSFEGFPSDASEELKTIKKADLCAFNPRWVSIEEVLNFNWDQEITIHGYVLKDGFTEYTQGKRPSCYFGDACGTVVSNKTMLKVIKSPIQEAYKYNGFITEVSWTETLKDSVKEFYTKVLPILRQLCANNESEHRLVLWFG